MPHPSPSPPDGGVGCGATGAAAVVLSVVGAAAAGPAALPLLNTAGDDGGGGDRCHRVVDPGPRGGGVGGVLLALWPHPTRTRTVRDAGGLAAAAAAAAAALCTLCGAPARNAGLCAAYLFVACAPLRKVMAATPPCD
eukprot:gene27241-18799_t